MSKSSKLKRSETIAPTKTRHVVNETLDENLVNLIGPIPNKGAITYNFNYNGAPSIFLQKNVSGVSLKTNQFGNQEFNIYIRDDQEGNKTFLADLEKVVDKMLSTVKDVHTQSALDLVRMKQGVIYKNAEKGTAIIKMKIKPDTSLYVDGEKLSEGLKNMVCKEDKVSYNDVKLGFLLENIYTAQQGNTVQLIVHQAMLGKKTVWTKPVIDVDISEY